jgi:glycosyltransferase involved in cell wall biosynthesis
MGKERVLTKDETLNVLQVNTEKTWRGGERQTLLTMKGLLDAGAGATLLCLEGYPLADMVSMESMPLVRVRDQKQAFIYLLRHGSSFDLIHAQTGRAQSLAVLARPFHRRGILYTRRVDFKPHGPAAKLKYRHTDQLIAISPAIREILMSFISGKDIQTIPSCIDSSRDVYPASDKALELKRKFSSRKIVATIAAMVPHKEPLTMVRTIHELKGLFRDRFVFLHFGGGELEDDVRREVQRLGLEKDYILMGFEKEVERCFPVFDVFVMSSQEEGLGSSVLEAFRYGIPVVSTTAGGLEELVSGRGLLCPVHDHVCLARKINAVLGSPDRFTDMVQNARDYVMERHSLERMTRDYLRVYKRMLDTK